MELPQGVQAQPATFEGYEEKAKVHGQFYFRAMTVDPQTVREKYYIDKGKTFSSQACALDLGRNNIFRRHPTTRDLYIFNEQKNIYEQAEDYIARWAQRHLGDLANQSKVSEITAAVARTADDGILPHPRFIQLKNCVFDLLEGRPVQRDSSLFFTRQFPIIYDANANCETFANFYNEILPDKNAQKQLLEFLGYCLYYDRPIERSNFILWGSGANGKSTLLGVFREFIGIDNIATLSLHDLEERFGPINLFDKCANIQADLPGDALKSTSKFKQITGGDAVWCDRKGKEGYKSVMPAKFIFSANSPPEVPDHEPALFRRIILVHFAQNFEGKEKRELKNELIKPEQLSGVFNLVHPLVKGLLENNHFSNEPTTKETQELYMTLSRPMYAFIKERLDYPTESIVEKHEVFRAYVNWATKNKRVVFNFQEFCRKIRGEPELAGLIYNTKNVDLKPCFGGFSIKNEEFSDIIQNEENQQNLTKN